MKIDYNDLGGILKGIGFDGCDLSVQPGGHVAPAKSGLFLMPALEAMTGAGLDVPIITTAFTSPADPNVRNVLGLAGLVDVAIFRPGHWNLAAPSTLTLTQPGQTQRELIGLASIAAGAGMSTAVHNYVDEHGEASVSQIDPLLRGVDPRWVGFDFDIGYATVQDSSGWQAAAQAALPRLKAVTVRDFTWSQDKKPIPCALGQGVVEWPRFFTMLAAAKFTGPISIHMEYKPKDDLAAIRQDLQFIKKQISETYRA